MSVSVSIFPSASLILRLYIFFQSMSVFHTVSTLYAKVVLPDIYSLRVYPLISTDSVFDGTFPVRTKVSLNSSVNTVVTLDLLVQNFAFSNVTSPLTVVFVCSIFDNNSGFLVYPSSRRISENHFRFSVGSSAHHDKKIVFVLRWSSTIFHENDVPICQ